MTLPQINKWTHGTQLTSSHGHFAGVVQTYLTRLLGMDFMAVRTQYVSFWIFWVWAFGLVVFLPGVLAFLWDFLVGQPPAQRRAPTSV
jgi:nitric oxide reductase large subunit